MKNLLLLPFLLCTIFISAQENPYQKFGKVKPEDFQQKIYSIDSNANAVVLSDLGETSIEGNTKGWFSARLKHHKVIHILNKNGYDMANFEIPLYTNGREEEKLNDIKAVTYNLENGKITQTKLEKSNIFKEKRSKYRNVQKFTMPAVKEGSIIEVQYEVTSDFIEQLDPWEFQSTQAPTLWSEYTLSVPQFFTYSFLAHGFNAFNVNNKKDRTDNFRVIIDNGAQASDNVNFTAGVTDYHWAMKDVPQLKEESFTSAIDNHLSKMEFQLISQSDPLTYHDYRSNWTTLTKSLLQADYFGASLSSGNGWMDSELKPILAGATDDVDKAKRIYTFLRNNITCTTHYGLYGDASIKDVFKTKKGNVAEINLLLTAMLRHENISAVPVILSTTGHGYTYDVASPMLERFNYVVCQVTAGDKVFYLDASHPTLGFARLLPECYNGSARLVNEEATRIDLSAQTIKEASLTSVFLSSSEKGGWTGTIKETPGYFHSYSLRNKIKEKGKDDFIKEMQKDFGSDMKIQSANVDSLNNYDDVVGLQYDFNYNTEKEPIIYFNPMLNEGYKKNPFTSAERKYPVEMPYTMDETYVLTMDIPAGYVVDELPKQILAKYDEEGKSFFEYRISQSGSTISLRSRIKIDRVFFAPEEYENLREFFNMIVKKQSEQIVFKKKA